HLAGLIENPSYRLPLVAPSKDTLQLLEKTLQQYEVIA
ncbi:4-hydroxy-tetrahydrodipicolinate synthase, partial [Staphylococcus pseudintermedius]